MNQPPNDTRERILRATLRLIGREGMSAVSNRRVAAAAEVSLGSLTYHFSSKVDLLRESLLLYVSEEVERLEGLTAEIRSRATSTEQIAQEVERIIQQSADHRPEEAAELELHLQASRDPALQAASRRCFEAYEEVASAALEALGVPDARRHATPLVAMLTGMAIRRLGTGRHDASGVADALLTFVRGAGLGR